MNKILRILILVILTVALILPAACTKPAVTTTTTISLAPGPQSSILLQSDITVAAETNQDYAFIVENYMKDASITGSFSTFGGAPNAIVVYLMDDATYNKWIKGVSIPTLYNSGSLSIGAINQIITVPGKYHLTFSNTFPASIAPAQQVKVNILLNWTN